MNVEITKEALMPLLIYDKPITYCEGLTLHPVRMGKVLDFNLFVQGLTVRKDSIFPVKQIIKMTYLEFVKYTFLNEIASEDIPYIKQLFPYVINVLNIVFPESNIEVNPNDFNLYINNILITDKIFDDIRRIIFIQNDVDFDMDEFINKDTLLALDKAKAFESKKNEENANIEDYIDSMVVGMHLTEEYVEKMSIRKFWRYIKRLCKHDDYKILKTAEYGGMVTFKEPIKHWITTLEVVDKYSDVKADEKEIREKIG